MSGALEAALLKKMEAMEAMEVAPVRTLTRRRRNESGQLMEQSISVGPGRRRCRPLTQRAGPPARPLVGGYIHYMEPGEAVEGGCMDAEAEEEPLLP